MIYQWDKKFFDRLDQEDQLSTSTQGYYILCFVLSAGTIYLLLNHIQLFSPKLLPLLSWDIAIPFLCWSIFPYLLLLSCDVILPLWIKNKKIFRISIRAAIIASLISSLIWGLYPTTYPRPELSEILLTQPDPFSLATYQLLVLIDTPSNCFPSGHITMPAIFCFGLCRQNRRHTPWYLIAMLLLDISVLTTKQHYLLDMISAFVCAAIALYLSERVDLHQYQGEAC
jgi:membrane-associated phospholipid phosphatase